jgi:hypothetical protein
MNGTARPEPGDLLEFFDGEGFVSGTMMGEEHRRDELHFVLQVGNERQSVHHTDVMAILKEKSERETDVPLLSERFRTDL